MLDPNEVINHFTELKNKASKVQNRLEREILVDNWLNKYSIEEWNEIGRILHNAKLL